MKKVCIQVERSFGEKLRLLLIDLDLLDSDYPITSEGQKLFLPIRFTIDDSMLSRLQRQTTSLTLVQRELTPQKHRPTNLTEILQDHIPAQFLPKIPHSLDVIGDIAIVELDEELTPFAQEIGQAILLLHNNVVAVYSKAGNIAGPHRLRALNHIAGELRTHTVHVEYGIRIAVDVANTYFSPRLSTEHNRVVELIQPGEMILDMFAGVGPFALLAAKRQPVTVYAIDINEHAIKCLKKSLELNQLAGEVIPILGDCRQVVEEQLSGQFDRVIMNLPHESIQFLDTANAAANPAGAIIHLYTITSEDNPLEKQKNQIITVLSRFRKAISIVNIRQVKQTAPYEAQVVLDVQIEGTKTTMTT
ncbi:MAG: class I SAM-dependent methyltransferase family protein [Promethearchaeota archaeon]